MNDSLDAQVAELRQVLNHPLRVSNVSAKTFPLRVWERMFALDREQRAADAMLAAAAENQSVSDNALNNAPSHILELTSRSLEDTSPHGNSSSSSGNGSDGSGGSRRQAQGSNSSNAAAAAVAVGHLRACRAGTMNASFMRDLVRSSLRGENINSSMNSTNNLGVFVETTPPQQASSRVAGGPPLAVLSCVTVPERESSRSPDVQKSSNLQQSEKQYRKERSPDPSSPVQQKGASSGQQQLARRRQQQQAAAATDSRDRSPDTPNSGRSQSVGSFRSQPVRPFAPIAAMWGSPINTSNTKHQLQHLPYGNRKPVVERHDLPFEVTPANDFRQLPHALTGLGHAVPYEELLEEQAAMRQQIADMAARR